MKKIKKLPTNTAVDAAQGDISAAEDIGSQLAIFLANLAGNKAAQKALLAAGVGWIGDAAANLVVERLCAPAKAGGGKTPKSGMDLFANFLTLACKPTLRQQHSRWLSTMMEAYMIDKPTNAEYIRVAEICRAAIDANDRIFRAFKDGSQSDLEGYNPAIPPKSFGIITKDKLKNAYRDFKAERDSRDNIHRAK